MLCGSKPVAPHSGPAQGLARAPRRAPRAPRGIPPRGAASTVRPSTPMRSPRVLDELPSPAGGCSTSPSSSPHWSADASRRGRRTAAVGTRRSSASRRTNRPGSAPRIAQYDAPFSEDEEWTHVQARPTTNRWSPATARRPAARATGSSCPLMQGGGTLLVARGWESGSREIAAEAPAPPPERSPSRVAASRAGRQPVGASPASRLLRRSSWERRPMRMRTGTSTPRNRPLPNPSRPCRSRYHRSSGYPFGMILVGVAYAAKRGRAAIRRGERDDAVAEASSWTASSTSWWTRRR